MSSLQGYVDQRVLLILTDGRTLVGTLRGYDQKSNVVISDTVERTYSRDEPVKEEHLGLYIAKGDTIVLLGEFDEQAEANLNLDAIRADPLPGVHW